MIMTTSNTDNHASLVRSKSPNNPRLTMDKKKKKRRKTKAKMDYSKQLIHDIRYLLWVVTIGALGLAWYCISKGYIGSLPWITSLVALPWSAHGVICTAYLNLAKADHSGPDGGLTYKIAEANNFYTEETSNSSPPI
mgnify:CR=1 FL=1